MAINKVDLTVTQLVNDLNEGYTWLKKDDLGYGSIETKYGASAAQIMAIRKHPALKDAETTITIFNIIDDTKNQKTEGSTSIRSNNTVAESMVSLVSEQTTVANTETLATTDASDIFANL